MIAEAHRRRPMVLGLRAPAHAAPGSRCTVRFVALVRQLKAELRKLLVERSPHAPLAPHPQVGAWQPGTAVRLHLSGPYLKARPALPGRDSFTWNGSYEVIDFEVEVDEAAPSRSAVPLQGSVSVMGVWVALVRMELLLSHPPTSGPKRAIDAAAPGPIRRDVLPVTDPG